MPIRIQLDLFPDISGSIFSRYIRIFIRIYPDFFWHFLTDITIIKSTKNYIVGIFSTNRIYPDFFPAYSGFISSGLKSGYSWKFRGNPDIAGFSSEIFWDFFYSVAGIMLGDSYQKPIFGVLWLYMVIWPYCHVFANMSI